MLHYGVYDGSLAGLGGSFQTRLSAVVEAVRVLGVVKPRPHSTMIIIAEVPDAI
jgi:hypothetical protein